MLNRLIDRVLDFFDDMLDVFDDWPDDPLAVA